MKEQERPDYRLRDLQFRGVGRKPARDGGCRPDSPPAWVHHEEPMRLPADPFLVWLLESAGLDARHYRAVSLQRRLSACLRAVRAGSVEAARSTLQRQPGLLQAALDALLPGVTGFFRDAPVFEYLKGALPSLGQSGQVRVWSAACAGGQELYSVAILLAEAGLAETSALLGTDCRLDAITEAKAGIYAGEALEGLDSRLRSRYFLPENGRFRLIDGLRARVRWRTADLFTEAEAGPWDLILWRNHGIYLNAESAHMIWTRLVEVLRPGGVLVTGGAERPERALPLAHAVRCVYRRTGE